MSDGIDIVIPVLGRPQNVAPLVANIAEVTTVPYKLWFVVTRSDQEELAEVERFADGQVVDLIIACWEPGPSDYAKKINAGYSVGIEDFIFTGADDLRFHPGWDIAALARMEHANIGVVGTNDLGNPKVLRGEHSTHSLVRRSYADDFGVIDKPGAIYPEVGMHEFVDDELVETAKFRGAWIFAADSIVEHLHPHWSKHTGPDALYEAAPRRLIASRRIYNSRRHLWKAKHAKPVAPISVIVGTYGGDEWRDLAEARALASVDRQSTQPHEVIHVHGENLAAARNEGAARATAPRLCFLDADDELHPRFLATMVRYCRTDAGLLNPAVQFIVDGKPKPPKVFRPKDLALGNYLIIGTVVRADLFTASGGFDEKWRAWEDWQAWRKVVHLGGRIVKVPGAIYKAHMNMQGRNNTVDDPEGLRAEMIEDFERWKASL